MVNIDLLFESLERELGEAAAKEVRMALSILSHNNVFELIKKDGFCRLAGIQSNKTAADQREEMLRGIAEYQHLSRLCDAFTYGFKIKKEE